MIIKRLFCFILCMVFGIQLYGGIGETGIPSLMLDSYSVKAMALSDAFVGIGDDISTISVNPAGLNTLDLTECSIMYLKYPLDMSFGYLAFGTELPGSVYNGYIAGSLGFFYLPGFQQYDSYGNKVNKKLSASDFVFTVGYANNPLKLFGIKENLNIGINFKYIQTKLAEDSKSSFGVDTGVLYKMDFISLGRKRLQDNLGIGVSIQNLGTPVKYQKEDAIFPMNFRIGIGYNIYNDKHNAVLLGFEVNMPNDNNTIISMGIEYSFIEMIFIRAGYKNILQETDNVSFGIGGKYDISGRSLSFDYSLVPIKDLGIRHAVSLSLKLGKRHIKKDKDLFTVEKRPYELLIIISKDNVILFNSDKTDIVDDGYEVLNEIAGIIKKEDYKRLKVMVYTDETEDNENNLELTKNGARTIHKYLIKNGIDRKKIVSRGYGNTEGNKGKDRCEILIKIWKKGEEEKFKYHYFMGLDAFIKEGFEKAITEWKKALKIDPDNEEIKRRIKEAKSSKREF